MRSIDPALLAKFFQHQCTPAEYRQVLDWLATEEGRAYLAASLQEDLEQPDTAAARTPHSEEIYQRILATTQELELQQYALRPRRRWLSMPLKAAAVVTGAIAFCIGAWQLHLRSNTVTYTTAYGEVRAVTLPDQSVVTLNGNSTLKYNKHWGAGNNREIWIEGEAFFDVKPVAHQRFLVHTTHRINVEVLGTTFNVLDREDRMQVVLNTGKVRLSSSHAAVMAQPVVMQPGDLVEYKEQTSHYEKKNINAAQYASWKNHKLEFHNTDLGEVTRILQETYGIQVIVKDTSLLHQQFSGTVPSQNADMLLEGLSQLFDLKITRQETTVNIEKNHRQ
ncbi:DUF4974 domain-containing protein [Chitinophaga agrisoli]|uniref:DUF4974 domain-containing protein n=1 Tax=Chitinophaga agrisoli TaxID=2607653 RepID=A0A5B2VRE8_9BACT|nr:FecR domain-containing protein [Chitinophaga agrisoli]KAA2241781.1 DUF4974 domain-containing protein [Chitinophaga agrisoli]